MDADGYAEQNDLNRIEKWPDKDLGGLMDFVQVTVVMIASRGMPIRHGEPIAKSAGK